MSNPAFRLNPEIDADVLRAAYERDGRVRISALLAHDDAVSLRDHVVARTDWRQVLNHGDKTFELDRPTRAAMTAAQHAALDEAVAAGARSSFQYRYETLRVPDAEADRRAAADLLIAFACWLSAGPALRLLRAITACPDIDFADAQATAYAPGDLLTAHDDAVDGKRRRAAYVFGLTPGWRAEWGGVLLFHDKDGRLAGEVPGFNTLDIFSVPQPHSVSQVTTAAPYRRYSVTGWLRAGPRPG